MVKRRSVNESSPNGNLRLPLPVQSWLWQITTPFIRSSKNPSQTQLQRASTAQQFEVVLVQAQTRSQSPALCEALQSISRWRLIQAALPHVMHCAATILSEKFFTDDQMHKQGKFDANETKLLYTLHWILLDAASECEDNDDSNGGGGVGGGTGAGPSGGHNATIAIDMPGTSGKPDGLGIPGGQTVSRQSSQYIHSVCTVQLFVYLFAPLVMELREDQFLTLKLESGLRVWQAMWDFRSPEASCFSSLAKPRRSLLKGNRRLGANVAHIYIGKGTSMEQLEVPAVDIEADTSDYDLPSTLVGGEQPAPTANMSEICPLSAMSAETGADVEIVCELCQSVVYNRSGEFVGCKCNSSQRYSWTFADPRLKKKLKTPIDKEWIAQRLASVVSSMPMGPVNPDLLSATLFDVAVLRCLFCLKWKEQGVYWALRYVHKRLLEVQRELERTQSEEQDRPRSRSLPLSAKPPPDASFGPLHTAASIGAFSQDSGAGADNASSFGVKRPRRATTEEDGTVGGISSIGVGAAAGLSLNEFLATIASATSRRSSSGGDSDAAAGAAAVSSSAGATGLGGVAESGLNDSARFTMGRPASRPVIKVNNSEDELSINSDNKSAIGAAAAAAAAASEAGRIVHGALGSKSDSNIRYTDEDECEEEVPGSLFYIQENGHLNYSVILQAVYWVSKKHNKPDICVVVMNILFVLLQLDVVERREAAMPEATGASSSSGSRKQQQQHQKSSGNGRGRRVDDSPASHQYNQQQQQHSQGHDSSNSGNSGRTHLFANHSMAMDTLIRVIKCIGCTHGCMDSYTGSEADIVRAQIHACLGKLKQYNPGAFRSYLEQLVAGNSMQELVDILHAFTGFCMDPAVHTSPKPSANHEQKNSYGTNFGQVADGEGTRGSEGIVIANLLRPLLAKFVEHRKELASQENMPLYSDVRNLLNYLREVHGCTFRRTLLTGLLDCIQRRRRIRRDSGAAGGGGGGAGVNGDRPSRVSVASDNSDGGETAATKSPTSRAPSVTSESHRAAAAQRALRGGGGVGRCDRRSLSPFFAAATSDSEGGAGGGAANDRLGSPGSSDAEESPCRRRGGSGGAAPPQARRRGFKSDTDDDSDKQNQRKKMSFRAAGQATLNFLSAKKRLEETIRDRVRRSMLKRERSFDELPPGVLSADASLQSAGAAGGVGGGGGASAMRQRRLINCQSLRGGMSLFRFLLDSCHPGVVPEPQLVAAMLDLEAPVVARACVLLECAHFVHRCGKGDWPAWMRSWGPGCKPKRTMAMQRMAGHLFHAWAETLGSRLEYFLKIEVATDRFGSVQEVQDEARRRALQREDEMENFLVDSTVNEAGDACPHALKAVAVTLLLEITRFLRDVFPNLPKPKSVSSTRGGRVGAGGGIWEKLPVASSPISDEPPSSVGSNVQDYAGEDPPSMPHPPVGGHQAAGHTVSSAAGAVGVGVDRRRISFAVPPTAAAAAAAAAAAGTSSHQNAGHESHSPTHSSVTSLDNIEDSQHLISPSAPDRRGSRKFSEVGELRRMQPSVPGSKKLLMMRRTSRDNTAPISRGQPSLRKKRDSIAQLGSSIRHAIGSLKQRKVSTMSGASGEQQAGYSGLGVGSGSGAGGTAGDIGGVGGDSSGDEAGAGELWDDDSLCTYFPWLKAVTAFANRTNFVCEHQGFCHPNCFERQQRQCRRLLNAFRRVYGDSPPDDTDPDAAMDKDSTEYSGDKKYSIFRRRSMFPAAASGASPGRLGTRDSTPLLTKLDPAALQRKLHEKEKPEKKGARKRSIDQAMIRYLDDHVLQLTQASFSVICKSCTLLGIDHWCDIMPVAWELLLEADIELATAAATVFLLAAVRIPDQVQELMVRELQHDDVQQRMNAVLRFRSLWMSRFQVWLRLEDGAAANFKIPPPNIEFVLPSPPLGSVNANIPDPPWMPRVKQSVEEVQLKQDEVAKTFVTASTTRRKQQEELMAKEVTAEEQRRRTARERFPLMGQAVCTLAGYEPALFHQPTEEHDEVSSAEPDHRRPSSAPMAARNSTARAFLHGPGYQGRGPMSEDEECVLSMTVPTVAPQTLQQAQSVFPSCICGAVVPIIHLLDDYEVNGDGIAVSQIARQVIWSSLVEDPNLFLRYFLEKLTRMHKKNAFTQMRQEELIFVLRKLIVRLTDLPPQAAHAMFNYILGYVMFYVRTPSEGGQEAIAGALSLLWHIVPFVQGIQLKDLKQTLRKEQCDPMLMITANVPSAKKIIVNGPDLSSVPNCYIIQEDTRFQDILKDSLEFFRIEDDQESYFLCDTKSHLMHNLMYYVRDFYFFKRNHIPHLSLVKRDPEEAYDQLQKHAFTLKFVEIGKILLTYSVLKHTSPAQTANHAYFLHEELSKLPSFPRKALETEFSLYNGKTGRELQGLDLIHKLSWSKLVGLVFSKMNPTFPWGSDIGLFLNVINGTFILHNEDASILRYCLATYINCCMHFKTIFATTGYVWIIPTILRVYNLSQKNYLITHAIECACKQFFILHRTPFILQLFGSIASSLDLDAKESSPTEFYKIKPLSLYRLLWSITEDTQTDALDILSMVHAPKPLKPVDFCYSDDPNNWNVLEAVSLCVTVVSYAPESARAKQMICILQATFPFILRDLKKIAKQAEDSSQRDDGSKAKGGSELGILMQLSTAVRQLLCNTDLLAKNARGFEGPTEKTSAMRTSSQAPVSVVMEDRDESPFKRMEEGRCGQPNRDSGITAHPAGDDDRERLDYITQREAYLNLTTDYFLTGVTLLVDQFKGQERISDLLDAKSIVRVVDVAMNLLKLVPCDPHYRSEQRPLITFICKVLPRIEWQQEALRVTLVSILRRFDKLYREIEKKMANSNRRMFNWDCLASLLDSVSDCLMRHRAVLAPVNHLKTLTNICIRVILYDTASMRDSSSSLGIPGSSPTHNRDVFTSTGVPSRFSKSVIKLVSLLMNSTDSGTVCSLDTICHTDALFSANKTAVMLGQLVLPLLLRCALQPEGPALSPANQRFALSLILNALNPRSIKSQQPQATTNPAATVASSVVGGGVGGSSTKHLGVSERHSITSSDKSFRASLHSSDVVQRLALIGLKIMLVAYSRLIQLDCYRVAKAITEIPYGAHLWKFVDFLVTNRPPIYPHLLPYIKFRMMQTRCESQAEHALQALVGQRLAGAGVPPKRCVHHVLQDLASELRAAKEESEPVRLRTASNASSMRPTGASFRRETSLKRNPSQRITAKDGSRCLQKYASTQNQNQQGLPVPSVDSLPSQGTLDEECELITETEDDFSRIHRNDAKSRKTFKSWRGRQQRSQRRSQKSSTHCAGGSLESSDFNTSAAAAALHCLPSPIPEGRLSEDRNQHQQQQRNRTTGGGLFKFARHNSGRQTRRVDSPLHVELASVEPSDAGSDIALVNNPGSASTSAGIAGTSGTVAVSNKKHADNGERVDDSENAAFLLEELIV